MQGQVGVAQVEGEQGDTLPVLLAGEQQRAAGSLDQRPCPGGIDGRCLPDVHIAPVHKLQQGGIGQAHGDGVREDAADAEQVAAAAGGRVDEEHIGLGQGGGQGHAVEDEQVVGFLR